MKEIFICPACNMAPDHIEIKRIEKCYYKYFPDINQWEDYHGSGSVLEQISRCSECNAEVKI